jgi:Tol biopolymer transport system component
VIFVDDLGPILESVRDHLLPSPGGFERLMDRRARRQRNRRIEAGALALTLFVGTVIGLSVALSHRNTNPQGSGPSVTASVPEMPSDAIVFARAQGDSLETPIELAYVPSSGGEVVLLTNAEAHRMVAAEPRWSPDGSRIAFVRSPIGHLTRYAGDGDVYVMDADGTHVQRITQGLNTSSPAWSPDGSQLVFVTNQGQQLVVMDADGSDRQVIASSRGYYQWPTWSPDGRSIAFQSTPGVNKDVTAVFTIQTDGTGEHALTDGEALEGYPSWSPDGSRIAYAAGDELWVMNADGTDQRVVTDCRLPCVADMAPSWAPDGAHLAFVRQEEGGGATRLYVLNLVTGRVLPVTPDVQWASWPAWRPVPPADADAG